MIQSREIALRCASAMPSNLLRHRWPSEDILRGREIYGINRRGELDKIRQLDACKDDEARRLLLGKSR